MNWAYWQLVTEKASRVGFDADMPFAQRLLSAEGSPASSVPDLFSSAKESPHLFVRWLAPLSPEQKDIMIEYFLLRKTQSEIAEIHAKKSQGKGVGDVIRECLAILLSTRRLQLRGTKPLSGARAIDHAARMKRLASLEFRDPDVLGHFEVDLRSDGIEFLFTSRAGQVSNAAAL